MARIIGAIAASHTPTVDFAFDGKKRVGAYQPAVDFGCHGSLGQTGADIGCDINRTNATGVLQNRLVGQDDFQHRLQRLGTAQDTHVPHSIGKAGITHQEGI